MENELFNGCLDAVSIDKTSDLIAQALVSLRMDSKEILKIRLSAEEALSVWAEELGENTGLSVIRTKRFGKSALILRAAGRAVDPSQYRDSLLLSVSGNPSIAAAMGLNMEYSYTGGGNELRISLRPARRSSIRSILIAILAALFAGVCLRQILPESASAISDGLIAPFMNTITSLLRLISGPLVFLSIVSGIVSAGDAASFGKIGGGLIRRFLLMTLAVAVAIWLSVCWLFPVTLSGGAQGGDALSGVLKMVLDIVPDNIVAPFQTGNAMQIIFLAICFGVACILLGDSVPDTVKAVNQLSAIVQKLMAGISRLLPAFVFLCVVNLILLSDPGALYRILFPLLLVTALDLILPLAYGALAAWTVRMPLGRLLRMQFPAYLLALATASSSAAFSSNVDLCKNRLGIDERLVNLGVPFGQVLFMPGSLTTLIALSLFMADHHGIPMTPQWIITLLLISAVLAVATPPIPGGGISSTLILFAQLGIPVSDMAICATVLTFTDYTITACNIACLQQELLISAKKQGLLKTDQRRPKERGA